MNTRLKTALFLLGAIHAMPALSSQALVDSGQDGRYTVIINNTCHRDINVAIHYLHPQRGWVTQGWWDVAANSELETGVTAASNRIYMHGNTPGRLQWPPERSRKEYNRYTVRQQDFLVEEPEAGSGEVPFSLKEIPAQSTGLKARFDC